MVFVNSDSQQSTFHKPSVLLILSHADLVEDPVQQRGIVAVHEAASMFRSELDVLGDIKVFCVNSTSSDKQMANLKAVINQKYQQITMVSSNITQLPGCVIGLALVTNSNTFIHPCNFVQAVEHAYSNLLVHEQM